MGMLIAGEDYLECVSKQIDTLRPFVDSPRVMKMLITRTFVAARSFGQGLVVSGEVVRKVSQVKPLLKAHLYSLYFLSGRLPLSFSMTSPPSNNCD